METYLKTTVDFLDKQDKSTSERFERSYKSIGLIDFYICLSGLQLYQSLAINCFVEGLRIFNQIYDIIVHPRVLPKFCCWIFKRNICKIKILKGNRIEGLISLQRRYLCLLGRINLQTQVEAGKKSYINYKSLIIWIQSCSCKVFFSNQFHLFSGKDSLGNSM